MMKGTFDRVRLLEVAASSVPTPPAGTVTVFVDVADGEVKKKDDTGTVTSLEGGGGSGLTQAQVLARGLGS